MRFNQVIRAEPGAGECGPVSLNTKQAWAQVSENGKAIYSSAGGLESRGHGGPSRPLRWNCSAVTCAWHVHLGHVCRSWPHSGLGHGGSDAQVGLDPKSNLPSHLLPLPKLFRGAHLSASTQAPLWRTWHSSLTPLASPFAPHMQPAQHQRQEIQNPF